MEGCWLTLGDLEAGAGNDGVGGESASGPLCHMSILFQVGEEIRSGMGWLGEGTF